ncbi:MAG TPA: hypothetical protein VK447_12420 [Myxococcaceae bacterium]|nr:hypothetical protein [Myxococcaceae bacterium]
MPRPNIPPDRKDINFSVKLSPTEMAYLDTLKEQLGHVAIADAVRDLVAAFRTTFNLPVYQAERLKEDMRSRGLNTLQYLQELLAKRYEEVSKESPTAAPASKGKR